MKRRHLSLTSPAATTSTSHNNNGRRDQDFNILHFDDGNDATNSAAFTLAQLSKAPSFSALEVDHTEIPDVFNDAEQIDNDKRNNNNNNSDLIQQQRPELIHTPSFPLGFPSTNSTSFMPNLFDFQRQNSLEVPGSNLLHLNSSTNTSPGPLQQLRQDSLTWVRPEIESIQHDLHRLGQYLKNMESKVYKIKAKDPPDHDEPEVELLSADKHDDDNDSRANDFENDSGSGSDASYNTSKSKITLDETDEIKRSRRIRKSKSTEEHPSSKSMSLTVGSSVSKAKKKKGTTSKYFGVCWNKGKKKWRARISYKGHREFLGDFTAEDEAGKAVDKKLLQLVSLEECRDKLNFKEDYGPNLGTRRDDISSVDNRSVGPAKDEL